MNRLTDLKEKQKIYEFKSLLIYKNRNDNNKNNNNKNNDNNISE